MATSSTESLTRQSNNLHDQIKHRPHNQIQVAPPWTAISYFTTRAHAPILISGFVAAIVCGAASPAQSLVIGKAFGLFTTYATSNMTGHELLSRETTYICYLLAIGAASWLAHFIFFACWLAFGELQAKHARDRLFASLMLRDQTWYDTRQHGVGALVSKCHQQVRELQLASSQPLGSLVAIVADVCFSFGLAMFYSWKLTLVIISTLPLMLLVLAWLGMRIQRNVLYQYTYLTQAIKSLNNALAAIDVVKCFVAETFETSQYMRNIRQAASWYFKMVNINGQQAAVTQFVGSAMFVQGFYYGSVLVNSGQKHTSDVVTTFLAAMGAFATVSSIVGLMLPLEKGRAAGSALCAIIADACDQGASPQSLQFIPTTACRGDIEFRNCFFSYPTRPDSLALDNVTFSVPAGHTTFILGRSGSGKSTLTQLLLGFYPVERGMLMLDGLDIGTYDQQWLRQNISVVDQSSSLFDVTVGENIALGKLGVDHATETDVIQAAEFAQLQSLVWDTTDGINTQCGPDGGLLSGGQRQRVAIARSRVRNSPILILDEPTSALDHVTRSRIMDGIRTWRRGKTTIIITHDTLLLRPDDLTIVLEAGRLVVKPEKVASYMSCIESPVRARRLTSQTIPDENYNRQTPTETDVGTERRSLIPILFGGNNNVFGSAFLQPAASSLWAGGRTTPPSPSSSSHDQLRLHSLVRQTSQRGGSGGEETRWRRGSMAPLRAIFTESERMGQKLVRRRTSRRIADISEMRGMKEKDVPEEVESTKVAGQIRPARKRQSIRSIFSTIWPSIGSRHRFMLVLAMGMCMVHAAVTPVFAYILSKLISTYGTHGTESEHRALVYAMSILAMAAVDALCVYSMHVLLERVGQTWIDNLRNVAVTRLLRQPKTFFTNQQEKTISAMTESLDRNAEETRNLLGRFASLTLVALTMILTALVWALCTQWRLTLLSLCAAPYIYGVTRLFGRVNARWETRSTDAAETAAEILNQVVRCMPTVRALTLESHFKSSYEAATAAALRVGLRRALYTGFFYGLSESAGELVQALVFYVGARLLASHSASVADVVQVFLLLIMTTTTVASMLGYVPQVNTSLDAATRFLRLVTLPSASHEHEGTLVVGGIGQIVFRRVRFAYPGASPGQQALTLKDMSFVIEPGTSTAIVGRSGSGKSTVLSLLLKLYPLSGDTDNTSDKGIFVSGCRVSQIDTTFLRQRIAIVPQSPTLLSGTIAENITYGLPTSTTVPSAFPRAIHLAAAQAGIHDFIQSLPDGYATVLGDGGGTTLSGGQAQRIALARALVRDPQVLILDEATSALDAVSAAHIRQAVKRLVEERGLTVVAVTHSREMMETVDVVLVVEDGRVVQRGPFEELIRFKDGPLCALVDDFCGDLMPRLQDS